LYYLKDVENNGKEYISAMYVTGIFSHVFDAPIENW
jgi:hypothetical protein